MHSLVTEVEILVVKEYDRASEVFGRINASDHESFAVMLEEFQEASDDFADVGKFFEAFWELTKSKDSTDEQKLNTLARVHSNALFAACELIQFAAMAYKAEQTIKKRGGKK